MTRFAYDEESRDIYRMSQMRTQLMNCEAENLNLQLRIDKLEKEVEDLQGELRAAEEELDMYEDINEIPTAPEDDEL